MDDIFEAQQQMQALRADIEQLAIEISVRLPPRIVTPETSENDGTSTTTTTTPRPPVCPPEEILRRWSSGDHPPIQELGRRCISAIVAATADPTVGPQLSRDGEFVALLRRLVRPRVLLPALGRMYFYNCPPEPCVHHAIVEQLPRLERARQIPWMRGLDWSVSPGEAAVRLTSDIARRVSNTDWMPLAHELNLPDSLPRGPWAEQIVQAAAVQIGGADALDRAIRLLRFADGGQVRNATDELPPATVTAARWLVRVGASTEGHRERVLRLLNARVGDFFQVSASHRWRAAGLDDERRVLRSWRVREVLKLVFGTLVPNNMSRHQTDQRRDFWSQYQSRVEAIWVFAHSGLKARLMSAEVQSLVHDGSLSIGTLDAAVQKALVWMLLRSSTGSLISVIEGNANTPLRIRQGAHEPGDISYHRYDSLRMGDWADPNAFVKNHNGDWKYPTQKHLNSLGVYQ